MEEETESETQLSQELEEEFPIHFTENSEYGQVPDLKYKIDRIAVMAAQNKALVIEQKMETKDSRHSNEQTTQTTRTQLLESSTNK